MNEAERLKKALAEIAAGAEANAARIEELERQLNAARNHHSVTLTAFAQDEAKWQSRIAELEAELTTLRSWRDSVVARSVAAGRKVPGEGLCDWFEMLAECVAKLEAELAARPMVEPEAARKLREAWSKAMIRTAIDAGDPLHDALRAFCESPPPPIAPSESDTRRLVQLAEYQDRAMRAEEEVEKLKRELEALKAAPVQDEYTKAGMAFAEGDADIRALTPYEWERRRDAFYKLYAARQRGDASAAKVEPEFKFSPPQQASLVWVPDAPRDPLDVAARELAEADCARVAQKLDTFPAGVAAPLWNRYALAHNRYLALRDAAKSTDRPVAQSEEHPGSNGMVAGSSPAGSATPLSQSWVKENVEPDFGGFGTAREHALDAVVYSQFDASKHVAPASPAEERRYIVVAPNGIVLSGLYSEQERTHELEKGFRWFRVVEEGDQPKPAEERVMVYAKLRPDGTASPAIWSELDRRNEGTLDGEKWLALTAAVVREGGGEKGGAS